MVSFSNGFYPPRLFSCLMFIRFSYLHLCKILFSLKWEDSHRGILMCFKCISRVHCVQVSPFPLLPPLRVQKCTLLISIWIPVLKAAYFVYTTIHNSSCRYCFSTAGVFMVSKYKAIMGFFYSAQKWMTHGVHCAYQIAQELPSMQTLSSRARKPQIYHQSTTIWFSIKSNLLSSSGRLIFWCENHQSASRCSLALMEKGTFLGERHIVKQGSSVTAQERCLWF